jgi:hypothetical protein
VGPSGSWKLKGGRGTFSFPGAFKIDANLWEGQQMSWERHWWSLGQVKVILVVPELGCE